jgi:hypothetical protein
MPKRPILLILFPLTALLWLVGWTLFWLGSHTDQHQLRRRQSDPEDDTLCPLQLAAGTITREVTENEKHIN